MEISSVPSSSNPKDFTALTPWVHSIYVVTFDIEFGQTIEAKAPNRSKDVELTETEKNNICYSSFPDSNSSILGATQYHFRMRLSNLNSRLKKIFGLYNSQTTQALNVDTQFIYGYVYFMQKKDPSLKRGYFQKSLVILSLLPFLEFYHYVLRIIGSSYFENEQTQDLEDIYDQLNSWPSLKPGEVHDIAVSGANIALYIPNKDDKLNSLHANLSPNSCFKSRSFRGSDSNLTHSDHNPRLMERALLDMNSSVGLEFPASTIHGTSVTLMKPVEKYRTILSAFDLDLYNCFQCVISDLQTLWEMVLTCEPFIVIAHRPDLCAYFVQALMSLIYPFKFNSDFRPFFTIHDPEFRDHSGQKGVRPCVILGVTNPFFTKSLENWPNVIQLSTITTSKSSDQISSLISSISSMNNTKNSPCLSNNTNSQPHKIPLVDRLRFTSSETLKSGLNSKYRPFLNKDRSFISSILRSNQIHGANRPNNVQTTLIRRWLIELTQSFFMPLERYLTQMMPLHNKISAFKPPPELPVFDFESFLLTLDTSGPQLTTKIRGDWPGLYKKFFQCPNFFSWYGERKSDIDRKLWILHMESFLDIDLPTAIDSRNEIEVVDMIIKIRHRLTQAINKSNEYQLTCENLNLFKAKLCQLINALPPDLRPLFANSIDETFNQK